MTWTVKSRSMPTLTSKERYEALPDHLRWLVQKAIELNLEPKKVWIFGSRARGDARVNSDFDLAFELRSHGNWAKFLVDAAADTPSLFKYDIVDIDSVSEKFKNVIVGEGVIIYESP